MPYKWCCICKYTIIDQKDVSSPSTDRLARLKYSLMCSVSPCLLTTHPTVCLYCRRQKMGLTKRASAKSESLITANANQLRTANSAITSVCVSYRWPTRSECSVSCWIAVWLSINTFCRSPGCAFFMHKPYMPPIVDRSGTHCVLQSDADDTGLLQLGTLRSATRQHPEVAAFAEQCSQNRPPGTEAVPCQTADASITLATGSTQNWLQGLCVDIQDYEHVCTTVPQSMHQPPCQRTDIMNNGYATAHPAIRLHRLRETFFSMRHCGLSGTHFLHLSSEATHCLYSNLG